MEQNCSTATGRIFNLQRFCVQDGPGIRTTVFLKGCPLDCLWCHNPEGKAPQIQTLFHKEKCIGCGRCAGIDGADDAFTCWSGARELCGKTVSVDDVIAEVLRDELFYRNSGGGLTLSGGEPLMQHEFALQLLKRAKAEGLHTCIETSGCANWEHIEALLPYVDLFLWDVKESDGERHRAYTGVSNEKILQNLRLLNGAGASIVLRCPIVPGCNDRAEHFAAIAALAEELSGVRQVDIEPYHPLGKSKAESLGMTYALGDLNFPAEETVQEWVAAVAAGTSKPVRKN